MRPRLYIHLLPTLLALFVLGAGLRLFDLTDQPIDFHPTRQLRGAIVARGIYYTWQPEADDTTRRQAAAFWASTGQYEPSILEGISALTYLAIGQEVFWIARVYNTLFWLIGGLAVLALARRMVSSPAGESDGTSTDLGTWIGPLIVLAFYMALPFSVHASRSFQPDAGMVVWLTLAVYALWRWSEEQTWGWALAAGAAGGMAVLTKAVILFTVAGALAALAGYTYRQRAKSWSGALLNLLASPQTWVIGLLTILPTAIYYLSRQGRAAEYFSSWTLALSHLLVEPRFYLHWLGLAAQLLTPPALILALAGLVLARGRSRALLLGLWAGYLAYGLFLPYQMNTHNYYHLQLVVIVSLSMLPAVQAGAAIVLRSAWAVRAIAAAGLILLLAYSSWQALIPLYSRDYRGEPAYWQTIATHLPADGKIIALTQDYGYRLMYYGWRKVTLWPNRGEIKLSDLRGSSKEFEAFFAKRTEEKSYFLITAFRQFDDQPALQQMLSQNYPVLAEGQGYQIYDLTRKLIAEP